MSTNPSIPLNETPEQRDARRRQEDEIEFGGMSPVPEAIDYRDDDVELHPPLDEDEYEYEDDPPIDPAAGRGNHSSEQMLSEGRGNHSSDPAAGRGNHSSDPAAGRGNHSSEQPLSDGRGNHSSEQMLSEGRGNHPSGQQPNIGRGSNPSEQMLNIGRGSNPSEQLLSEGRGNHPSGQQPNIGRGSNPSEQMLNIGRGSHPSEPQSSVSAIANPSRANTSISNVDAQHENNEIIRQLRAALREKNITDRIPAVDQSIRSDLVRQNQTDVSTRQQMDSRNVSEYRAQQNQTTRSMRDEIDDSEISRATNTILRNQRLNEVSMSADSGWAETFQNTTTSTNRQTPPIADSTRRYMTDGHVPQKSMFHAPTTAQILAAHDRARNLREADDTEFLPYDPAYFTQKRTRSLSPAKGRERLRNTMTSVSVADFTPLADEITTEMALQFERQIARAPNVHLARDAITGRARRNMTIRLITDRHQAFVNPEFLDNWWEIIDCNTLSQMVIKYFGPQSITTRTIDQSLMALPFSFNFGDRKFEEMTLNLHYELLDVHQRTNGSFSPSQEASMAAIIEKRFIRHAALYADFKEKKDQDRIDRLPETVDRCLKRFVQCIQAVRDIHGLVSRYGSYTSTHKHVYPTTFTGIDPDDIGGINETVPATATTPPAAAVTYTRLPTSTAPKALPKAEPSQQTFDAPIKKRKPEPEPELQDYVALPASCHTCGIVDHATKNCPHKDQGDVNNTDLAWSKSAIGIMWAKCGFTQYQPLLELPDGPATREARAQRSHQQQNNDNNNTHYNNYNNNNNNNRRGTGYQGNRFNPRHQHPQGPQQQQCKVSTHVLAALHNKEPNPDFISAQIFLLQQMSRRGATTLAKDPVEAPPDSVLGQILLDSGSLAGDFISKDLLDRLKGQRFIYRTTQPITVCSGLDGACYTSSDMLDIAILIHTPRNTPKIIRFSVRINPSSSCDFIIGRKSLKKHNFFNMFPSHFVSLPEWPEETGPFDELRWVNNRKRKSRFSPPTTTTSTLTNTALITTPHTTQGRALAAIVQELSQPTLIPLLLPQSQPVVIPLAIPQSQPVLVPLVSHQSLTEQETHMTEQQTSDTTTVTTTTGVHPILGEVTLTLTAPPEPLNPLQTACASDVSSAVTRLPCGYQGTHCFANSAPTPTKNSLRNRAKKTKRQRRAVADSTGRTMASFGNLNTMAAMITRDAPDEHSPTIWNPTRVVLAVDDINNDKTDTFAPFLTPDPTAPVTSFLDEITFGGDEDLQARLRALCTEYSDIFSDTLPEKAADLKPFEINVNKEKWEQETNRTPTRPQSSKKMTHIKKHIDDMLKTGIIEKADVAYYSHPVIVQKTENSFRFCIDYRGLNEATEKASWPLPNITQLFDRMSAQRPDTFGVMDLTSGYHQAPLADAARKFTAFLCFAGLFQFTRLPFGPKRAPSYFQEQMASDVLAGLVFVICEIYLDDIIIYATGNDEFVDRTRQVFARLRVKGLRLKAKKTKLGLAKIEYVGKEISAHGLSMSTTRIKAFLDIPRPRTVTDLRKFLGVANYFHMFIANHSAVTTHLHKMIEPQARKSTKLTWSPQGRVAFETLRDLIANCPLLHFPNDTSPIILRTDASDFGIGGVLFQTIEEVHHPIAFVSKSLTEVQLRWSVIQKEAYAIFHCCTQLDYLLRDRKFIIETDHRNLTYMQKNTNSMVIRWDIALQELDYELKYIKGTDNEMADAMSRLCVNHIEEPQLLVAAIETLSQLTGDQLEALHLCHNSTVGHGGVDRTIQYLQRLDITWPAMRRDTKRFIKTCPLCQKMDSKKIVTNTVKFTTSTYEPWQVLNMDFIGPYPSGEYVHVIIDTATRWVEISLWPDATANSAALALLNHIGRYGTPRQIRSDRGSHFANHLIKEFLELVGTPHNLTLAYSSEENAIVERANKEINRHLRALIFDFPEVKQLARRLPFVMRILNTTKNAVTGLAPAQLLFGNVIDLDEGILLPRSERPQFQSLLDATNDMIQTQDELCQKAAELRRSSDELHLASQNDNITTFEIGSYVLVKYTDQPPTRLHTLWSGPFQVLNHKNSEYKLLDLVTKKEKLVHATRIKEFRFNPEEVDPLDIARRDTLEFFVEEIREHRGNPRKVSTLQFLVKWQNYTDEHNTWESWANLRLVGALHKYLRENKMTKLIPSTEPLKNRN